MVKRVSGCTHAGVWGSWAGMQSGGASSSLSHPLLFLGEGKRKSHKTQSSERVGSPGRIWRPPPAPDQMHMRQEPGPRAQDKGQAQWGSLLGLRPARASFNLGLISPQAEKRRHSSRGQEAGASHRLPSLPPKRAPPFPQPGRGMEQATETHDLLSPWALSLTSGI